VEFGAELLGWTDDAADELQRTRGWTEDALERLALGWHPAERRVGIPVRDEHGDDLGELRYDPTGLLKPKMLAAAGATRQLFPPPELITDQELDDRRTVWLVEGEPDAIRLWSIGIPAVAVPGAGNWRDEWAARLTGRRWRIVVCFDCDQAGRRGARRAATAIVRAGGDARHFDLDPTRDDGYDLTDWAAGADTAPLREQAAAILTATAQTLPLFEPDPDPGQEPAPGERPWRSVTWATFRDTAAPEHVWLIDGLLPAGALAFVAGPPKRGKTWLGIAVAIAIALGRPLADAYPVAEARHVLYLALEGSQTGLRTRIGALARGAGIDPDTDQLDRLHMLYRPRPFDLAELATSDWLLDEAADVDAALVIVDVLRAAARFKENAAEDFARIRDHLNPLLEQQRTVALLHHFGKLNDTQKERSPGERMAGTGAMYGALDVGFLITRSDNGARLLGVDVEARDFAAPDRLGLAIVGEGTGKHGGYTYTDTATLIVDEAAGEDRDYVGEVAELLDNTGRWMTLKELHAKRDHGGIGANPDVLRDALEPATAPSPTGTPTPLVRLASGQLVGRSRSAQPYGTWAMFDALPDPRPTRFGGDSDPKESPESPALFEVESRPREGDSPPTGGESGESPARDLTLGRAEGSP
jgi:hypothetical protein